MKDTKIEWCDHSWSPWRGCTKVSPGCAHCYAETLSKRNPAVLGQWGKGKPRVLAKNWKDPVRWNKNVLGDLDMVPGEPDRFTPYHRPTVFPSLCDWLDDDVPVEWLAKFLQLIHETPNLTWLLLTKRPENFRQRIDACVTAWWRGEIEDVPDVRRWASGWLMKSTTDAPSNVWVGTSVEDQPRADQRIPELLRIPAAGRFLCVAPLLEQVELGLSPTVTCRHCDNYVGGHATGSLDICTCRIDWVIIGGESGPRARPCNVDWIRSLVRQCRDASVPCFVKQLGARPTGYWVEGAQCPLPDAGWKLRITHPKGGDPEEWPADLRVRDFREGLR